MSNYEEDIDNELNDSEREQTRTRPTRMSQQYHLPSREEHQFDQQSPKCAHQVQSSESDEYLPFFPKYDSQLMCQQKLLLTWFEVGFSQTRYNAYGGDNGCNGCTLIAILMAYYCAVDNVAHKCEHNQINFHLIRALATAMLRGNDIYSKLKHHGQLPNVNLSIPEAIECAGKMAQSCKEWKSLLYMQDLSKSLHANLEEHLGEWCKSPYSRKYNYLFTILICDTRSVLFIFNKKEDSIALIDSHQHSDYKGAVIAIAKRADCRCLCTWYSHALLKYHESDPNLYELSFLFFKL